MAERHDRPRLGRALLWACGLGFCLGLAHPFYVAICQIDHNPKTRALEITFRFFSDDLETALETVAGKPIRLGTDRESADTDRWLADYLKRHVQIVVNGQAATFRFLGKEVETDLTWCYVEVLNVPAVKTIKVTNRLLLDQFSAQSNIVHVRVGGAEKSLLLREGYITDTVEF